MFIEMTDGNLVTTVFNVDHIAYVTLTDAGRQSPYQPLVSIVLKTGEVFTHQRIATVDDRDESTACRAIWRFFRETLGAVE